MKKLIILSFVLIWGLSASSFGEALSDEYQKDLLDRLLYIRGLGTLPSSLDTSRASAHCGTPDAFSIFINRSNFSDKYKAPLAAASSRDIPANLTETYISPAGRFNIHYTMVGVDSVYHAHEDIIPPGGDEVPDYINKVGQIADSVYDFEITHLGYPAPPSDGLAGGDSLYDIYVHNLGIYYYGLTSGDSTVSSQRATSYLEIDNDYNFVPYTTRPLDAIRVTIAHEFFHAIHFGMDYTEYEGANTVQDPARLYWWEMSATWMEEMAYDNINDYYGYLPGYYDYPWVSLVDFSVGFSMHPYGSAIFPIFLTEKWDTSIVQDIWFRCRDYGTGAQFLRAADDAIFHFDSLKKADDIAGHPSYIDSVYHLHDAFQEFAVWNLFTGSRASRAPAGLGFSEAANYAMIPDSAFLTHDSYPIKMIWPNWRDSLQYFGARVPQNLAANYINLTAVSLLDSLEFVFFGVRNASVGLRWDLSVVGFPLDPLEPAVVKMSSQPEPTGHINDLWHTEAFYNIVAIPTPASIYNSAYPASNGYAYLISDSAEIDTSGYTIKSPFPNPMVVSSGDDKITFRLERPLQQDQSAYFKVLIFDIAGEKIKELDGQELQTFLDAYWHLDNAKGEKVAPGVYLALCRATFSDDTPEIIKKFKLAVIK